MDIDYSKRTQLYEGKAKIVSVLDDNPEHVVMYFKDDAIIPEVALDYFTVTNSHLYFKFVVCDAMDMVEVDKAVDEYKRAGVEVPVYVMAVGGTSESYFKNAKQVAKLAMEKGYRYSPRLHVDIFGNAWGT